MTIDTLKPLPRVNASTVCGGSGAHEAWNVEAFAMLGAVLGRAKVDKIAETFRADLLTRFARLDDRDVLRRDSHSVSSAAGMLGFTHLSDAARSLEIASAEDGAHTPRLARLLDCRQEAIELLTRHFK